MFRNIQNAVFLKLLEVVEVCSRFWEVFCFEVLKNLQKGPGVGVCSGGKKPVGIRDTIRGDFKDSW